MDYGTAGRTPTNGIGHLVGKGGYVELFKESETDFDGSDGYKDITTHLLPKNNDKHYTIV